jgi:hypothetical protein
VVLVEVPEPATVVDDSGNLGAVQNPQYIAASLTGTTDSERRISEFLSGCPAV